MYRTEPPHRKIRAVFQLESLDTEPTVLQYRSATPVIPKNIVLHYSRFRCAWDWLILVLTYYTAVRVPYNAAFSSKTVDDVGQLAADSVVDVVFFVDVLLNCHTSFVATSGDVTQEFPATSERRVIKISFPVTSQSLAFLARASDFVIGDVDKL